LSKEIPTWPCNDPPAAFSKEEKTKPADAYVASTGFGSSVAVTGLYFSPVNASHDTVGFQFVKVPVGLAFHAQTCRV
jgi:hypothetical protein